MSDTTQARPQATDGLHRPYPTTLRGHYARLAVTPLSFVLLIALVEAAKEPATPLKDRPHIRGPVAAAWMIANCRLVVANRCGSISVVDTLANEVIEEVAVGERLAAIKGHPTGKLWLTVDEQRHELIELVPVGKSLRVATRRLVPKYPVDIAFSPDGSRVGVVSLWSRKLTVFAVKFENEATVLSHSGELALGFNPGWIEIRDEGMNEFSVSPNTHTPPPSSRFWVHDAFGQAVVVVNGNSKPPRVISSQSARSSYSGALPLDHRWRPAADPATFDKLVQYGSLTRAKTRVSPIREGHENLYFNGTVVPLGPLAEPTPIQRGERRFFGSIGDASPSSPVIDNLLSSNTFSCNYCHRRGHTTYERSDTTADGSIGAPKRIPTLLGTRLTDPWAWNGSFRDLNEQVRSSLVNTLHVKNFTPEQVADITAYLHTLPPPPPLEPATDDPADQRKLARGKQLFQDLGCATCHVPPLTYTSPENYDVGLADEKGLRKFNPPSLRGVSQGYTFFHDGRAKSLEEIFTVYGHQLSRDLENGELADLLRFLRSL